MPWTVKNPPPPAKNWTEAEKRRCVKAANAVLKQTGDEGQAVRACIHAAGKTKKSSASALALTQSTRPLALKPLPFMAAIESARMRGVVLPEVYYGELIGLARALAFTVSRLATVDQIDRVLKKLVAVLEDGGTLADFKRLAERDPDVAALPEGRVETIFRNGAQTAYNRGRAEHHIRFARARPYLMYSAINDSRVRPAHLAMDNVIAPMDHPIWARWYPPNGHRCRCSVIALTRAEAERRGITVEMPRADPDPGWDYSVMDGSDLAIRDAATRKRQAVDPALAGLVPEGVEPPKTLEEMIALGRTDLEELETYLPEHIREGKGVYYERVREYKKALAKLYKARGITTDKAAVVQNEGLGAVQVKRASQEFPDAWTEKADAFGPLYAEHTEGRAWQITLGPNFNTGLLDLDVFGRVEAKGRDGYIVSSNHIDAVHEYTHRLQAAMPELDDYFQKLHVKRTAGTELELLREVTGNPNYRPNEKTRKDDYLEPYMGKEYEHNAHQYTGRAGALEMMTVAYQMLLGGDGREFRRLYSEDRELLELSLALLLRYKP